MMMDIVNMLADGVSFTAQTLQDAQEAGRASGINGSFTLGVAGAGAAVGVGLTGMAAATAVGRNPGAFGNILTIAIIGMALAEAIAIYALVLALMGR
jgi:F-type H+-transporting ATPase subunit c